MGRSWKTPEERFWEKVDRSSGPASCWLWKGCLYPNGYGQFNLDGTKREAAHRVSLMWSGVDLGDDHVHHICGEPSCVNPKHLEVISAADHSRYHCQKWTREVLIAAYQLCAQELGRVPAATDWNRSLARALGHHERADLAEKRGWPDVRTVQTMFGSWNNFVRAAGFVPRGRGHYDRKRS